MKSRSLEIMIRKKTLKEMALKIMVLKKIVKKKLKIIILKRIVVKMGNLKKMIPKKTMNKGDLMMMIEICNFL